MVKTQTSPHVITSGLAVGKDRLCLWPVFADGWAVGKISLPMALLCHRHSMWFADGLFPGHRQTMQPSANKPFPVVMMITSCNLSV
jgi:hypothetical protein